jgi:malonyl-CoA O-methyltransferase
MKIVKEFSRFAHEYKKYNVIQKEVAKHLCSFIEEKYYQHILDIGAGDGSVYKNLCEEKIEFDSFTALDFSREMLLLHPSSNKVHKICLDFNKSLLSQDLGREEFDLILSSSALQWSLNLDSTLQKVSNYSKSFYFSFFTSGTFKTLHKTAKVQSPIYSVDELLEALKNYYSFDYEVIDYVLNFESVHEMLRYIKKSGVSSGERKLSYKETKSLMSNYPLKYLEFEVLLVRANKKEL